MRDRQTGRANQPVRPRYPAMPGEHLASPVTAPPGIWRLGPAGPRGQVSRRRTRPGSSMRPSRGPRDKGSAHRARTTGLARWRWRWRNHKQHPGPKRGIACHQAVAKVSVPGRTHSACRMVRIALRRTRGCRPARRPGRLCSGAGTPPPRPAAHTPYDRAEGDCQSGVVSPVTPPGHVPVRRRVRPPADGVARRRKVTA